MRVRGCGRLVHEVHKGLAPAGGREALGPCGEIALGIRLEAKPHVTPRRGFHQRRRRIVLALGQDQRRSCGLERVIDVVVEPRLIAKLERGPVLLREERDLLKRAAAFFARETR